LLVMRTYVRQVIPLDGGLSFALLYAQYRRERRRASVAGLTRWHQGEPFYFAGHGSALLAHAPNRRGLRRPGPLPVRGLLGWVQDWARCQPTGVADGDLVVRWPQQGDDAALIATRSWPAAARRVGTDGFFS